MTGRWVAKDPGGIWYGVNLYACCNNDPLNYVDVTGRDAASITAASLAFLGAGASSAAAFSSGTFAAASGAVASVGLGVIALGASAAAVTAAAVYCNLNPDDCLALYCTLSGECTVTASSACVPRSLFDLRRTREPQEQPVSPELEPGVCDAGPGDAGSRDAGPCVDLARKLSALQRADVNSPFVRAELDAVLYEMRLRGCN